jgi:uncharacterized membrane protein YjjB (DUF3815 family)
MDNFLNYASDFFGTATVKALALLGLICLLSEMLKLTTVHFSFEEVCATAASAVAIHSSIDFIRHYIRLWMANVR